MDREVQDIGIAVEGPLGAVSVVDIPVHHRNALAAASQVCGCDTDVVEEAESHRLGPLRMVARWPDGNEGGGPAVAAQGVDGGDSRPGGVDRGIPRGGDCEGVGVEVPAAPGAEVMDRVDVAGVVDELEDIPVYGWRLEVIDVQGGGADPADDGVDPRNAFGMTDRRPVMATELVRD